MTSPTTHLVLDSGDVVLFDQADADRVLRCEFASGLVWEGRIADRQWHVAHKPHTDYCVSLIPIGRTSVELRLHRAIMGARADQVVDHRNGNGLDCRRENLRLTDGRGNAQNRRRICGRALPKGVALHKQTGRYEAYIRQAGQKIHLGLFDTPEAAAQMYDLAALRMFGEFANTNHQQIQENTSARTGPTTDAAPFVQGGARGTARAG
jgi:hypothetical protein